MKKIIIFDFNRTIYDPEKNILIPYTKFVLRILIRRGYLLCLISRAGKTRKELVKRLKIDKYFYKIIISKEKTKKDFIGLFLDKKIEKEKSYVVGDRIKKEIKIGNSLGLKTIWIKNGKFASELPKEKNEKPTFIVKNLKYILIILKKS